MPDMLKIIINHPEQQPRELDARYGVYLIGSDSSCRIVLDDGSVEDAHAVLTLMEDESYIEDLMGAGVYVSGERVRTRQRVFAGVPMKIGNYTLVFREVEEAIMPEDYKPATVAEVFQPRVPPRNVSTTQAVKQPWLGTWNPGISSDSSL